MDPELLRNKWLCPTRREVKMVKPRTMTIPDGPKLSLKNFMNHRMFSSSKKLTVTGFKATSPFHPLLFQDIRTSFYLTEYSWSGGQVMFLSAIPEDYSTYQSPAPF
ncbi:uncharacterized protein C1orf105 homolog [Heterocephalus glaber]|uniref:Uncharacterized protein C1orf105 homolog n=1 Tax=Heterocephalus glaber TaxID=10181 RepID=A0AAX6TK21_HETGA|nr:uncharacterized protein C1orf105 homolog [Heterocephalus glaber]